MTINRTHLAGLNYARSIIEENWPAEALLEIVDNCIAQAQAAPEAEPVTNQEYYLPEYAGSGQRGVCINCNKGPTSEGHDGCLGTLPGPIMNACCGHGRDSQAYIQYWDGTSVRGDEAVIEQARLINATKQHDAEMVELLRDAREDMESCALSIRDVEFWVPRLLEFRNRIDAKLATLKVKP